jgi:putative ABC transport system permease protein
MWRTDAPGAVGDRPPTSAADQWQAAIQVVTPSYFGTMGVPVRRGRAFDDTDRFLSTEPSDSARPPGVAIVNEAMAKRYWGNADPLGTRIMLFDDRSTASFRTVVGVVADVRAESVGGVPAPTVFLPFAQHPGRGLSLVIRSDLAPEQLVGTVTARLRAFDVAITGSGVRPLDSVIGDALSRPRFAMLLVGAFAVLALAIAGVGVFGIVAFLVALRTPEIGIRTALGARPASVVWLVLGEGLRPVVSGVVVGTVGAVIVTRMMAALLYGVAPLDVVSFAIAAAVLIAASVLAAAVPARRAAGIDPLRSLRGD